MKKDFQPVDDNADDDIIEGDNALERFQNRFLKAYLFEIFGHELHLTEVRTLLSWLGVSLARSCIRTLFFECTQIRALSLLLTPACSIIVHVTHTHLHFHLYSF